MSSPAPTADGVAGHRRRLPRPDPDLAVCALFLLFGAALTAGLWPDPATRMLALNPNDQTLFEWFLAMDTRLATGDLRLISDRLNAPYGVNLMANTSVIVPGVLLAPLTALAGAPVSFAVLAALNLGGTAAGWYLLFRRTLGTGRLPAATGGALCGFAPGMLAQSNAHLHMTAQWLVPVLVWLVVRLVRAAEPTADGRNWRSVTGHGAALAAVVTVQLFVGEEVLFLTALSLLLVALGYAARRHRYAGRVLPGFLAGLAVTAALAAAVLGYPLWVQFLGPQAVADGPFRPEFFSADLAGYVTVSPLSLLAAAGWPGTTGFGAGPTELNTHLGWPLVVATVAGTWWLRRHPLAVACAGAALVMAALSLGPTVLLRRDPTGFPGPYRLLAGLPVVDGALPTRFALAVVPLLATVLVLVADRASRSSHRPVRLLVPAALLLALVPVVPAPLRATDRPALPRFISQGHWRDCVRPGGVLVPVPPATPVQPGPMRWATATGLAFAIPEGFFIGPYGAGGDASMGVGQRPTAALLTGVARSGQAPALVTGAQRAQAAKDLAFWGASCVVLPRRTPNERPLLATAEALLGPATPVADAWTWRVR